MAKSRIELMLATVAAFAVSTSAFASNTQDASVSNGVETQQVPPTDDPESSGEAEVSADDMADTLNSMQQLQQTVTLKRTVNGEVIETEKRTVTYSRDEPYRETEAGRTTIERLKAAFDGEALTRTEAFEEAKIDFVIADADRNELITAMEFTTLVENWRKNKTRAATAPNEDNSRQRQYDAFLEEIDPESSALQTKDYAYQKFAFMAGAAVAMSLTDYIREYLLDFDSMDTDKDMILTGDELMRFRALNRGETLDM